MSSVYRCKTKKYHPLKKYKWALMFMQWRPASKCCTCKPAVHVNQTSDWQRLWSLASLVCPSPMPVVAGSGPAWSETRHMSAVTLMGLRFRYECNEGQLIWAVQAKVLCKSSLAWQHIEWDKNKLFSSLYEIQVDLSTNILIYVV